MLGVPGRCSSRCSSERPTRFELLTAAAFRWFADEAVDVAVVEVGLGGTLGLHQRGRRPRWPWSPTSATTTPRSSVPTLEGIARDKAGIIKAGQPGGGRRDRPRAGRRLRRPRPTRRGRSRSGSGARSSTARPTGWPSAGGWSTCARPGPPTTRCSCRCTGPPGGQRGRAPWPPPRPSSARRSTEDVVEEGFAAVHGARAGWRWWAASPCVVVDGAHNVAGHGGAGRRPGRGVRRRAARRWRWSGCSAAGTRRPCWPPLRPAGVGTVVACTPRSPRAMPAEGGRGGPRRSGCR